MDVKIYISLSREAATVLNDWATREHREPRQQASWVIEQELVRRGLLDEESAQTGGDCITHVGENTSQGAGNEPG